MNSMLLLATLLADADDWPMARDVVRAAQRRSPDNVWVALLDGTLSIFGKPKLEPAEASKRCAATLARWPKSTFARINLALASKNQNKPDDAVREFREAIRFNPNLDSTHFYLGGLPSEQRKHDEARREVNEAIRLNPRVARNHIGLGYALETEGKLDLAIAAFREAVRLKPTTPRPLYNLASALGAQEKFDDAMEAYEEAKRLNPELGEEP